MERYPKLWREFFRECLDITDFEEDFKVSREVDAKVSKNGYKKKTGGRIDLLIRDSRLLIIIENKVKSDINKVKRDLGLNLNQLNRYQNYAEYLVKCHTESVTRYHAFLLAPDYNMPSFEGKKFKPLRYSEVCNFLRDKDEVLNDPNFLAFYFAMYRHSFPCESLSRYEDMKQTFFSRIAEYHASKNTTLL